MLIRFYLGFVLNSFHNLDDLILELLVLYEAHLFAGVYVLETAADTWFIRDAFVR